MCAAQNEKRQEAEKIKKRLTSVTLDGILKKRVTFVDLFA